MVLGVDHSEERPTPPKRASVMADDIIAGRLRGVRVLVVDDDDDNRELAAIALRYSGALVTTASSAREGLSLNFRG